MKQLQEMVFGRKELLMLDVSIKALNGLMSLQISRRSLERRLTFNYLCYHRQGKAICVQTSTQISLPPLFHPRKLVLRSLSYLAPTPFPMKAKLLRATPPSCAWLPGNIAESNLCVRQEYNTVVKQEACKRPCASIAYVVLKPSS